MPALDQSDPSILHNGYLNNIIVSLHVTDIEWQILLAGIVYLNVTLVGAKCWKASAPSVGVVSMPRPSNSILCISVPHVKLEDFSTE